MVDNQQEEQKGQQVNVIVQQGGGGAMAAGICALIFGIIGIFFLAIVFVPLSVICAIIAIIKKQYVLGICSIVVDIVAFMLSPTLLAIFGIASLF